MQTGDGAMNEVQTMLQRVRDLAVEYNNGTLSSADEAAITNEVAQLCAQIVADRCTDGSSTGSPC